MNEQPSSPPRPEDAPEQTTPEATARADAAPQHTAIKCLVAIARHHGLDVSGDRLIHDHALAHREPTVAKLVDICAEAGLRARPMRIAFSQIAKLEGRLPAILRQRDGTFVILSGFRSDRGKGEVVVLDPQQAGAGFQFLDEAALKPRWGGEVIFLRRAFKVSDTNQPFGLRWFLAEALRERRTFRDVGIAALVLHVLGLASPIFFQIVVDKVLTHHSYTTLTVLVVGVMIAIAFDSVLNFLRSYLVIHATNKIDIRLAVRTFRHLLSLPITFFERSSAGVLTKHMQQVSRIREFLTGKLFNTLLDATALVVLIPLLLFYSWQLTILVVVVASILAVLLGITAIYFRRKLRALYMAEGERQALLVEAIHGATTVKALSLSPMLRQEWDQRSANSVERYREVGILSAFARSFSKLLEKLLTIGIIGFGAMLVIKGEITVGALIAFNMMANRVTGPLVQLATLIQDFQETGLSLKMLGEIMNRAPEQSADRGLQPQLRGGIEFEQVTFSYGEGLPQVLNQVSFQVSPGQVLGVVGRSGSGKSTLVRLVQGLYPPQQGLIRIDGLDLRQIDMTHLRRSIGVVLQDTFLFRGTVRQNISLSQPTATFEQIVRAARMAGADEFIERLPKGYDTMLEESATNLSGGQKQRLSLARALLREPPILILDEATSALDPESEALINRNLGVITRGRTTIIVSHRLGMIRNADAILVVDQGRLVDFGKHDDLVRRCAIYRQLWLEQTRHLTA